MGSRAKELEELWERNKALRKAALRRDASPKLLQSLPLHLRTPVKVHGFARPKGLRASDLVEYLMLLGVGFWGEKRFDDCINALLQHGIVKAAARRGRPRRRPTFEFTKKQFPAAAERHNEYYQTKCLAEIRAREVRCGFERQACREVAAEWGWPGNSLNAAAQQLRDHYRRSKK
jgi:hypothetical protein